MDKKVIIWGHPPDTHTHSYIHLGFAKAFSHLNYDVVWYDDDEEYANEDLTNAIIISEKNCTRFLPIEKSSQYFIHNLSDDFCEHEGDNIHNLLVYHENYNWGDCQRVDDYTWYDPKTKTIVIMWATDLLPGEIEEKDLVLYKSERTDINYVGTLSREYLHDFSSIVNSKEKRFIVSGGYTYSSGGFIDNEKSIKLMRESYLNFDLRPDCHIHNGYIPCRIFKTMSYGCWVGTNSEKILNFFDGRITACSNLEELYMRTEEDSKKATKDILRDNQNYIKENHTYLNRIKSLLLVL